ncbi:M48 family metallopeptidase [Pseudomonas protegens]|uniref:M48 family metallopeptidase n=1 Tax=Pseudomonas protegens TaxID=380021 RepID=UPI00274C6485|nr:M48 family metallopeptidase [Pseudomonas protegens]MDP9512684.1 M48 family metallopeptidase [Pseudomonas protegens]
MKKSLLVCALSAAVLLTGCETVNTTSGGVVGVDRTQYMLSLLSSSEISQSYAQDYQQTVSKASSQGALDKNGVNAKRLQVIANRLIAQAPTFRPDAAQWNWEVNLIRSDEINANCGPGGKIIFYSGLIDKLKLTDDEIAAVMGHEIAHALREHSREAMSKAYGVNVTKQMAVLAGLSQDAVAMGSNGVTLLMTLPNSRENENEADLIGLELAARAGYNPNAAISLWNKMSQAADGSAPPELLSTHPASTSRIASLQAAIPKVMPLYEQAKKS